MTTLDHVDGWIRVKLKAIKQQTNSIRSYEFEADSGAALPVFSAGSHIDVEVVPGVVRQYSLCNCPDEISGYQIAVMLEQSGKGGSRSVHEKFVAGQTVLISKPRNNFPLSETSNHSHLFAGGIGITPLLSMAHRLYSQGRNFSLHYSAHSPEEAAFLQEIEQAPWASKVAFYFSDQDNRLNADRVLEAVSRDSDIYICGPTGYIEAIKNSALSLEWPEGLVKTEFFSADMERLSKPGDSFTVHLCKSGVYFDIPANRTIADVLLDNGMDVPLSCEEGICGTCLTRVVAGRPDHRDMILSKEEKARNTTMTICCSRSLSSVLTLDL